MLYHKTLTYNKTYLEYKKRTEISVHFLIPVLVIYSIYLSFLLSPIVLMISSDNALTPGYSK